MKLDIFTLFPEAFDWFRAQRSVTNAVAEGNELRLINYRDTTPISAGKVDDSPYGGGAGMVLRVDVVDAALEATYGAERPRIVLLSPTGPVLSDAIADELIAEPHLALLCGRYEGFDERVRGIVHEEISLGDFVMTGGEVCAMAIVEATVRLLPGVLGNAESAREESHAEDGLLEYPHYTRPAEFRGQKVPEMLSSGNHAKIAAWRREQALERTRTRRPDLLEKAKRG